jgi:peptidoglycan/xylan/chitin deacetylase (PgdA/CDA1 family)
VLAAALLLTGAIAAVLVLVLTKDGARHQSRSLAARSGHPRHHRRHHHQHSNNERPSAANPPIPAFARLLRVDRPIYCGGNRGHAIALTFDDGPGPYTHLVLRKLAKYHQHATFFDVGRSMNYFPGYLRPELRLAAIGDHTYSHPPLTALPAAQISYQLRATKRQIEARSGQHVNLFRPPYELYNSTVERIAHRLRMLTILWNVDSQDSLGANYVQIIANVSAGLHAGAIILMHENHGQTIRALTTILPLLKRHHLHSVSIPQLLASDPPSTAQLRRGGLGCGTRKISGRRRGGA